MADLKVQTARRFVVNNLEIREQILGAGDPLLMIHGWGASGDLLLPLARELAGSGYRLFIPDLPGFGESDTPSVPFSIFDYARFCLDYLDAHGIDLVAYFGHSLGGRIGLILGAEHSDRIRAMTLSNSAGIQARTSPVGQVRLTAYKAIRDSLCRLGAKAKADTLRQAYNRRYGSADFLDASPVMRQTLINVVNQDLLPHARRAEVPTALIWGDADDATPLWMGRMLEREMPDAALILYPGAGHYAYLDDPRRSAVIMHALYQAAD